MTRILRMDADFRNQSSYPRLSGQSASSAFYLAFVIAAVALLLIASPAAAQEENRAGLVIVHSDGSVTTQCVAFAEPAISGADLLARSGLDLAVEASSMGGTICRIDGEGCDFPQESCFCQCQGSPCIYWSYWRRTEGAWLYSNAGAGNTTVNDGAVEGWRWGPGTVEQAEAPPDLTFEEICASPPIATDDTEPAVGATEPVTSSTTPAAAPSPDKPASQPAEVAAVPTPTTSLLLLLGVLAALPLAALALWWLRRPRKGGGA
jgi:hypothetical protein